jgi:hypothetical protein
MKLGARISRFAAVTIRQKKAVIRIVKTAAGPAPGFQGSVEIELKVGGQAQGFEESVNRRLAM